MNRINVINGLIYRIEMNTYKNKNKKQANQLVNDLKKVVYDILVEPDDAIFAEEIGKLFSFERTYPFIANNFFWKKIGSGSANIWGFSNDFRFEIRWLVHSIKYAEIIINEFISAREKYDNYILLNKYEEAHLVVKEIEKEYGKTYWGMECEFFLNNKIGKSNEDLMSDIVENVYGSVLYLYNYKSRESVSSDEYYYNVGRKINDLRKYSSRNQSGVEFLNYMISANAYEITDQGLMSTLKCMQFCPIIDRYLFFLNVAEEVLKKTRTNDMFMTIQTYIRVLKGINDDHLAALRFVYDDSPEIDDYSLKSKLTESKIAFVQGKLVEARENTIALLSIFPNNAEAMRMVSEINILLNDGKTLFDGTNLGVILQSLQSVYTLNEQRDDAIEEISKLALECSMSTWARCVISDVLGRCYEYDIEKYTHYEIIENIQHLDIETVIAGMERAKAISFIKNDYKMDDEYIRFRLAILEEKYSEAIDLCEIDAIKDLLFVCDNHSTEEKMMHLNPVSGEKASFSIKATIRFLNEIDIRVEPFLFLEKAAELVVDNIYTALYLPWEKIINFIDDGPSEIRKTIYTPILYYVYVFYLEKNRFDDLGIICDDFLRFEKIERPSAMHMFEDKYDKKMLVYFLKNVCSVKVLDDALDIFENTQERDKERVEICNILTHIDPENAKEYENEIREITRKLMINKELKIIDESRIHVNSEGIRERLSNAEGTTNRFDKSVKNDYQRFLFYQEEQIGQWVKSLISGEDDRYKEICEATHRLLEELILKIRDAFVEGGEYGLDGYLSLNIRHNTLDDELRSPFHRTMLYVKKSANGSYIYNNHWSRNVSSSDEEILNIAFAKFYTTTEAILYKLKKKYIQVKTEKKNAEGLFDYTLYESDIEQIAFCIKDGMVFDEFFDIVINYLWTITEQNLLTVKAKIRKEIYEDYLSALRELADNISGLANVSIRRELLQKTKEAETDVYNTLERICYWFQRSNESKHSDFDLQFAFDLGYQTIINMHPEKRFVAEPIKETESSKIPGDFLKNYEGLFYNILDNIFKKATPDKSDGSIKIRYSLFHKDEKVRIYIENDYDCSGDISEDREKIACAKQLIASGMYIDKVNGEGGTGLLKIYKILVSDLKLPVYVEFGYVDEKNIFYINIES